MRFRSRRTLAAAAGALVLLAGGATALAESGSSSSGSRAGASRVERDLFVSAIGGRGLFAAHATAACRALPLKPPLGDPLEAAANYVGLSVNQLAQELEDGKTLAEVAKAHGKSVDGLKQAQLDAAKADLDRSVAAGDITAEEEQQLLSQLSSEVDDFVNGKGGLAIRIGGPSSGAVLGGPFKTAADHLGLSVEQLMQELQDGKSLADIAAEHGKSVDGLKKALIDAATADIEKAVDDLVSQKGLPGPPCAGKVAVGVVLAAPGLGRSGTP